MTNKHTGLSNNILNCTVIFHLPIFFHYFQLSSFAFSFYCNFFSNLSQHFLTSKFEQFQNSHFQSSRKHVRVACFQNFYFFERISACFLVLSKKARLPCCKTSMGKIRLFQKYNQREWNHELGGCQRHIYDNGY